MKNMKLYILGSIIVLMGLISSCESEDDQFPVSISFSNSLAKDSVFTNDNYTITGTIKAEGQIKMIQFYRNYFFNDQESEVEMAGTKITNIPDNNYTFSVNVPNVTKNTTVRVKVTEVNGSEVYSAYYTIKERKLNISTYTGLTLGGWNSNYGSCLDVDSGTPLSGSAVNNAVLKPTIDVFFEDAKLGNVDLDSIYYDNVSRLSDTGIRYAKTSFTSAQFDQMRDDYQFKNMTATKPIVSIAPGDVIFFIAKSKKKGLLKVVSLSEPMGDLVLDEKIQK